jgi:hypothetical protein
MACRVCRYYLGIRKPPCKGCTAGTDPAAQDFLEWLVKGERIFLPGIRMCYKEQDLGRMIQS